MGNKRYELFDVTADTGIIAYGDDLRSLFENAAIGMFSLIVNPDETRVRETVKVDVRSNSLEDLLVAWLNELIFIFEIKGFLLRECRVLEMDENHIIAEIRGEGFDPKIHSRDSYIKAATYHGLEIKRYDSSWMAKIIFDV